MAEKVATNVVASGPPNADRLQRRPLVPMLFNSDSLVLAFSPIEYCLIEGTNQTYVHVKGIHQIR